MEDTCRSIGRTHGSTNRVVELSLVRPKFTLIRWALKSLSPAASLIDNQKATLKRPSQKPGPG